MRTALLSNYEIRLKLLRFHLITIVHLCLAGQHDLKQCVLQWDLGLKTQLKLGHRVA